MKHGSNLIFSFILLVGDFLGLVGAFSLAYVVRVKLDDRPLLEPITANGYIAVVAVLLVFWLLVFALLGLYRSEVFENRFKEALMLLVGSFIGILFLIGTEYVLNRAVFPARLVTAYGFVFALLLTLLIRTIARSVKRALLKFNVGVSSVLLVGNTAISTELIRKLNAPHSGYTIVGIVGSKRSTYEGVAASQRFSSFEEAIAATKGAAISSIVQTELYADQQANDEILTYAQENHIAYRFVPGNSRLFIGSIDVNLFEGIPTIAVHQTALTGWGRIAKRIFDFAVSIPLTLAALPVLALLYLIIKITDPGPVIYKEPRLTRYDNTFHIYKFRTFNMKANGLPVNEAYEKIGETKLAKRYKDGDDTIPIDKLLHPLGKFLRLTSLDELPQLFNVIKGDISLVGPRPLVHREINTFSKKNIILSVKPGMTGLAAVSGRRGIPFEERRKLDMYYVQNWSFLLDIVILLKTVVVVVRRVLTGKAD